MNITKSIHVYLECWVIFSMIMKEYRYMLISTTYNVGLIVHDLNTNFYIGGFIQVCKLVINFYEKNMSDY